MITDMGNTEIFELHETSSKIQCPDCALHWEVGVELEPKLQKYKGRVVLHGDFVKDDSGAHAVFFTERGSSASQKWMLL